MLSRLLTLIALLFLSSSALAQDTIVVQTLTLDSVGRAGYYRFPNKSEASLFENVIMQYRMRCINGDVRTNRTMATGCGEWDYNCETYITDSSRIDSVRNEWPSAIISGFNGTSFPYTDQETKSYIKRAQHDAKYPGAAFTEHSFGKNEAHGLRIPLHVAGRSARIISLFKEWELKDAGLSAGLIYSLKLSAASNSAMHNGFKIRMRRAVTAPDLIDTGWVEVYSNANSVQTSSDNRYYFYQPYNWAGGDLEVELSYTGSPADLSDVMADTTSFTSSRTASTWTYALEFGGAEHFDIPDVRLPEISDELSVGMWIYGAPSKTNPSSTIMEGTDGKGRRTFNLHLPWDDGQVYFDCGDETGYDRINTGVPAHAVRGKWNHWMFTKNAKTGVMSMYLNGTPIRTDTGRRRSIKLHDLRFGGAILSSNTWLGQARKLTIHQKALDSVEIYKIIDDESYYGAEADRIAAFPLSIGSGQTLQDVVGLSAELHGNAVWRERQGFELQRGFEVSDRRPAISLYQSAATLTPTTITTFVMDTIAGHSRYVRYYDIFRNDSIMMTDSGYVWAAGKQYVLDEYHTIVDSVTIAPTATIEITYMPYYAKSPQKFEIMSFVTPYGIGLDLGKEGKMWEFDVTDYLPILNGNKRLSVERGAWQEELDIRFLFIKGTPTRSVLDIQQLWPANEENYQNIMADKRLEPIDVPMNPDAKGYKIRSMITGHGQEGEFIPRKHIISVNAEEFSRDVWKQCSDNPVYPQGGTWIYPRAGWCPGMVTDLAEFDVTAQMESTNVIDYTVKSGSGDSRYVVNNQLVSYGSPNFTVDAEVLEVIRPSERVEFARFNPAGTQPVITLRNNGSEPLTSLTIHYNVEGEAVNTFQWTGNLAFLDTTRVTLPTPSSWGMMETNVFTVHVAQPNGKADEYAKNDTYKSSFTKPPIYSGGIVIRYKTNKVPEQNYYRIIDKNGNVVLENTDASDPATTYYDSLTLAPGNYTFAFYDEGENGINFWATPADGAGTLAFRKNRLPSGTAHKTFNPDFGKFIHFDFTIAGSSSVGSADDKLKLLRVYPNPATDLLKIDLAGYESDRFTYSIVNVSGKRMSSGELRNGQVNIASLTAGHYTIVLRSKDGMSSIPFVKQ
ncbi:MAG TPA: peptide-N-glycosidase F-related protein [Candidatus Kapabacteria bacterium]|nr:peptide-N-glycosidase F-related protein [Candidatus Kapabacteria bacterium]